jgi:uncharacterized protein YeaO (DUF488 family)
MKNNHTIFTKRIYDAAEELDGYRILVDRLWPRGISKDAAHIDLWFKDIAPSTSLRKWFHHEAGSWDEFTGRYLAELRNSEVVEDLVHLIKKHPAVTFIYATKDKEHNHAQVLKAFLDRSYKI